MSRTARSYGDRLALELRGYPLLEDLEEALAATRPDAVSINTWPNTHAALALRAMDASCHVFLEKPYRHHGGRSRSGGRQSGGDAPQAGLGYILRVHPAWMKLVELGRSLGKPLVMRMNLNQQSSGPAWTWHKNLMESLTPIVDCGVHYVDVSNASSPARGRFVSGIGAKLSAETRVQNYGHLHVVFDDGSVGWYEAGWGPMMSEVAWFVKDVWGPKGSVSIVARDGGSADIDQHTKINALKLHHTEIDAENRFTRTDEWLDIRPARPPSLVRARAGVVLAHDPRGP